MFTDTRQANAMWYLDWNGDSYDNRDQFLRALVSEEIQSDMHGYMLYIGPGFVKLTIAVISWDESNAVSTMEDFLRNIGREEEINETDEAEEEGTWGEYEFMVEKIPTPEVYLPSDIYYHAGLVIEHVMKSFDFAMSGEDTISRRGQMEFDLKQGWKLVSLLKRGKLRIVEDE